MVRISAIVCTFKRPDYLKKALRSLCDQSLPHDEYEIIVVDNAVEAETKRVVEEFQNAHVNLRYVPEERVGLSRARNTGINAAVGPYVAFLDDDARADSRWLEALLGAFEQTSPSPAAVGGPVSLDWQGGRPAWVPEQHLSLYTYVDHGKQSRLLDSNEYLVGANLAFDKYELLALGGFDSNLGRQGAQLLSGEEAAILALLRERSAGIYYESAALVWHAVDESRKRPSWLARRLFWDGASQPLIDQNSRPFSRRETAAKAYSDLGQCGRWTGRLLRTVLSGKRTAAWESLLGLSQRAGRLRTHVRLLAGRSQTVASDRPKTDSATPLPQTVLIDRK